MADKKQTTKEKNAAEAAEAKRKAAEVPRNKATV